MADFAIYWKDYLKESGETGEPVTDWLTSREWLVNRLHSGDRIWLFIGGDACKQKEAPHQGFLAQLLVVEGWRNEGQGFRITGSGDRCILVDPPAPVDSILRQPDKDPTLHIGIARQNPFELDGGEMTNLLAILRDNYPDIYAVATRA